MKFFRNAVLGAMLFGAFAVSADDIYDNMIDTEAALKQWSNAAAMTFLPNGGPESDESAVRITATDAAKPVMAFFKVDIDKVRGKTVKLSAKVKGENISKPDKPYLGIKMMMTVTMADGRIDYPDTTRLTGDFGWCRPMRSPSPSRSVCRARPEPSTSRTSSSTKRTDLQGDASTERVNA